MALYSPWLPPGDSSDIDYPVAYPDTDYERSMSQLMARIESSFLAMQEKVIATTHKPVAIKSPLIRNTQVKKPVPLAIRPPTPKGVDL